MLPGRIEGAFCAKSQARGSASGHWVAGEYFAAFIFRGQHQKHSDGTLAYYQDHLIFRDASFAYSLQAGIHRFHKGGFFEADIRGQRNHSALNDPRHGANVFREAAAVGIEAGCEAYFLISGALRKEFSFAIETIAARNMMEADHAIARFELGDTTADFDYRASKFVAENLWRRDETVMNFLDVRATDAAGSHAEEKFTFADFGDRHGFNRHAALSTIDPGAHMTIGLGQILLRRRMTRLNWSNCLAHETSRSPQRLILFQIGSLGLQARLRKNPENAPAIPLRHRYFCPA